MDTRDLQMTPSVALNQNRFFKKGFQGVDKSAFDVLNDILKEK